jgi:hypothetical protein
MSQQPKTNTDVDDQHILPLVRFLSTQANSLLGMCSYTVREARSATTPDAFQVGTATVGAVGRAACNTGAFLVIPNSGVQAQYIYSDSRLLAIFVYFAKAVKSGLWAFLAEQHAQYT